MANFRTHLFIASGASSIATTVLFKQDFIILVDIPWLIFLGSIGGLLPDIDSDNSRPLKILFTTLGALSAILMVIIFQNQYTTQYLFIIAGSAYFIVRYPILRLFKIITVHRGAIHSVLCAILFSLLTVFLSDYLFASSARLAWLSGGFIGFGFIVHLLLDELYSVDIGNQRLKRSFGSAFKLFSIKNLSTSLAMLISCAILFKYTPAIPF